ncbi:MAG: CCA tRNA nucleotidyltransferase [Bdellovibrio sp.]
MFASWLAHPKWSSAEKVFRRIRKAGHQVYFAGGCVRDGHLGRTPLDFDLASSASPDEVESLFEKIRDPGRLFGTVVVVQDGFEVEVTEFRQDVGVRDGRRPLAVRAASAAEDAARRDFTVNALFWDLEQEITLDYVGGLADLKSRRIRAVGDPETRFAEDHLRILRALRFSAQLDFCIEEDTWRSLKLASPLLIRISGERLQVEFRKWIEARRPDRLGELIDSGVLSSLFPWNSKQSWSWDGEAKAGSLELAFWAAFLSGQEKHLWELAERLRFSRGFRRDLEKTSLWTSGSWIQESDEHLLELLWDPVHWAWVQELRSEPIDRYGGLGVAETLVGSRVGELAYDRLLRLAKVRDRWMEKPRPWVQARDLPITGILLGKILKKTYAAQLLGAVQSREQALEFAHVQLHEESGSGEYDP